MVVSVLLSVVCVRRLVFVFVLFAALRVLMTRQVSLFPGCRSSVISRGCIFNYLLRVLPQASHGWGATKSSSSRKRTRRNCRQVLVCGFFMQIAHKEGEKG
ncbi:hypothetical protein BDZ89DRAFT_1071214, partial [Hymenopellis radicata]